MMSEDQLYELARSRIERRNRRWRLWLLDLGGLFASLAAVALLDGTAFVGAAAALFLLWLGVFAIHSMGMLRSRRHEHDLEREVAHLRDSAYDEKPKRLELDDDGELVEFDGEESENAARSQKLQRS